MFRRVFLARLLLAALFGALLVPAQAQEKFSEPALSDPDSWTVVLLPDLQGYAKKACNQPIMEIMTSWIAAHAEALNTKLVLCVGDLVEQNDRISNGYSGDQSSHKQWEATARAFSQLDGVVPYMTATGNHDYTYTRSGARRTHLNEYFPIGRNPLNAAAKEPAKKQGPKKKVSGKSAAAKPETFAEKKARLAAEAEAASQRKAAGISETAAPAVPAKPAGTSETFAQRKARLEAEKAAAEAKKAAGTGTSAAKPKTTSKKTSSSSAAKLYGIDKDRIAAARAAAAQKTSGKEDQADA